MAGSTHPSRSARPSVVVAGHVCLDIIPTMPDQSGWKAARPGALDLIGPATLAPGGCVGNTGIALHRLGLPTTLVARVGDDELGTLLSAIIRRRMPGPEAHLVRISGEHTSYSLIASRSGRDRSIRHFPGVNDTFVASDVSDDTLREATLLHVGYPPLMAALVANGGRELISLMSRARRQGLTTSLDMASVNPDRHAGKTPWPAFLEGVLPSVDVFLPSLGEICRLLGRRVRRDDQGRPMLSSVARLAEELLGMGTRIVGIKLGEHGLYVRSASIAPSAIPAAIAPRWTNRDVYSPVFATTVAGTAGSGDATIAGFLFGLVTGLEPDDAVTAACAVGGASTEAVDGTSGIPSWTAISRRVDGGWPRRPASSAHGWTRATSGTWHGPRDAISSSG